MTWRQQTPELPLPISEHGLIGDLRTAALVGANGSIDWFCCPRFDSPSVFGSILDPLRGGAWHIAPQAHVDRSQQFYFPDSNVLITRFLTEDGVVEIHDCMPILKAHDAEHRQRIVRKVVSVRGNMTIHMEVSPRFDYGRIDHAAGHDQQRVRFVTPNLALCLDGTVDLRLDSDGRATAEFEMRDGAIEMFVFEVFDPAREGTWPSRHTASDVEDLFVGTVAFWRKWLGQSVYRGRWREMVHRSALTLKLLMHEPSGSMVAAPTTSLPGQIGGERNWDYRYVWIRDAALSLNSLLRMGFTEEAEAFMVWLTCRFAEVKDPEHGPLRVMYDVDCRRDLAETFLDHWQGHRGARPVRVGNEAFNQLQLDIYGEIIDAVYQYSVHGHGISHDSWQDLIEMVSWLQSNWDRADHGIWETRAGVRRHTFSRLMSWVAMDRSVRVARQRGLPGDLESWMRTRDEIYWQIMRDGWSQARQSFVQHYDDDVLDASLLLMPMVGFIAPTDPRFQSTLDAITAHLVTDSLVFRYDVDVSPDGVVGAEGTFSICSFWYVEALTHAGRLDDARLVLEKMFTYANHLGLYAEQVGLTGEQLGNFPQAFTHLSLISSAMNLDRALG
jgi:GH15 family glucan-1,4-alpha-glucosidase